MAHRQRRRSSIVGASLPLVSSAIACGLLLATGCAQKTKGMPDLAPVTGTVTLDGQPLATATISFSTPNGQVSVGGLDGGGRYELRYSGPYKGAAIGPNTVSISSRTDNPMGPNWKDPIPAKYNKKSELKVDVKPGPNTFDFELTSK